MIVNFKKYKIYENFNQDEVKVGDYVLISGRSYVFNIDQKVKILRFFVKPGMEVMFDNGQIGVNSTSEIIRYLTQDEIEDFEINIRINKFNV